jgi:hypothetical protein
MTHLIIQNVKRNRDECIHLIENIHHIFYAIVTLHIRSDIAGSLPPATLDHIGKFTEYMWSRVGNGTSLTILSQNIAQDTHIRRSTARWKQDQVLLPSGGNEHTP